MNFTDGLDGLAAGLTAISAVTFGIFAYIAGRSEWADYLGFFALPGAGELAIFAVALAGAAIGFLWFNAHPAEVFMGDTGSLAPPPYIALSTHPPKTPSLSCTMVRGKRPRAHAICARCA